MQHRKLGSSNLDVSEISMGCMSLMIQDKLESITLIKKAFDSGINFFDTADLYDFGDNEKLVGEAIRDFRQDIILATKVGNEWTNDRSSWTWNVRKSYILQSIEKSLKRLGTDYVDLYQIHGGTFDDDFDEVKETLELLIAQGKIRSYGISSIRPNVFTWYSSYSSMTSNMMQYSMLDTRPEAYFSQFEHDNVGVVARGVLAQGLLIGKKNIKQYLHHAEGDVKIIVNMILQLAEEMSVSPVSIALYYALREPVVSTAPIGFRNLEQFNSCLAAYDDVAVLLSQRPRIDIPKLRYTDHLK